MNNIDRVTINLVTLLDIPKKMVGDIVTYCFVIQLQSGIYQGICNKVFVGDKVSMNRESYTDDHNFIT